MSVILITEGLGYLAICHFKAFVSGRNFLKYDVRSGLNSLHLIQNFAVSITT